MKRFKLSLGGLWLIASISTLLYPVFFPTYSHASGFSGNAIAASSLTMFVLAFPSSVIATPLIFMVYVLLGVTRYSIDNAYMTVVLLFFVGLVQWFWIVPRILWRPAFMQKLELGDAAGNRRLFARDLNIWVDAQGSTPLERVLEGVERPPSPQGDLQSPPIHDEDSVP
jgi:hypothetical protein